MSITPPSKGISNQRFEKTDYDFIMQIIDKEMQILLKWQKLNDQDENSPACQDVFTKFTKSMIAYCAKHFNSASLKTIYMYWLAVLQLVPTETKAVAFYRNKKVFSNMYPNLFLTCGDFRNQIILLAILVEQGYISSLPENDRLEGLETALGYLKTEKTSKLLQELATNPSSVICQEFIKLINATCFEKQTVFSVSFEAMRIADKIVKRKTDIHFNGCPKSIGMFVYHSDIFVDGKEESFYINIPVTSLSGIKCLDEIYPVHEYYICVNMNGPIECLNPDLAYVISNAGSIKIKCPSEREFQYVQRMVQPWFSGKTVHTVDEQIFKLSETPIEELGRDMNSAVRNMDLDTDSKEKHQELVKQTVSTLEIGTVESEAKTTKKPTMTLVQTPVVIDEILEPNNEFKSTEEVSTTKFSGGPEFTQLAENVFQRIYDICLPAPNRGDSDNEDSSFDQDIYNRSIELQRHYLLKQKQNENKPITVDDIFSKPPVKQDQNIPDEHDMPPPCQEPVQHDDLENDEGKIQDEPENKRRNTRQTNQPLVFESEAQSLHEKTPNKKASVNTRKLRASWPTGDVTSDDEPPRRSTRQIFKPIVFKSEAQSLLEKTLNKKPDVAKRKTRQLRSSWPSGEFTSDDEPVRRSARKTKPATNTNLSSLIKTEPLVMSKIENNNVYDLTKEDFKRPPTGNTKVKCVEKQNGVYSAQTSTPLSSKGEMPPPTSKINVKSYQAFAQSLSQGPAASKAITALAPDNKSAKKRGRVQKATVAPTVHRPPMPPGTSTADYVHLAFAPPPAKKQCLSQGQKKFFKSGNNGDAN